MLKVLRRIARFTRLMIKVYIEDDTFDLGASLAYYTIFSIVPLLLVVIAVSGIVAGPDAVQGQVFRQLNGLVGPDTAKALESILGSAYISGKGWMATSIGLVTLFIGATGIFNSLKSSLNKMWEIQPRPRSSVVHYVVTRLLSFSFVMGLGFLLIATFTLNALVSGLSGRLGRVMPELGAQVLEGASLLVSYGVSTLVFACIFKLLPSARIAWKDVLPGAFFTAVLFGLGRHILGFWFDSADPASAFGAAAGLISLLIWTFYSSQTFFLGAEFVYVWCEEHGRPIRPSGRAVRVMRQEVVIHGDRVVEKRTKAQRLEADRQKADRRSGAGTARRR